jgi:hypothetical protein
MTNFLENIAPINFGFAVILIFGILVYFLIMLSEKAKKNQKNKK